MKSTLEELRAFSESTIWEDLKEEIELWKESAGNLYDTVAGLRTLGRIQGIREACDRFASITDVLIASKLIDIQTRNEQEQSGDLEPTGELDDVEPSDD